MSRRSYKTVNLPREVVDWIDSLITPSTRAGKPGPLGITSRDEFVRIAVAVLGSALKPDEHSEAPLTIIQQILQQRAAQVVSP